MTFAGGLQLPPSEAKAASAFPLPKPLEQPVPDASKPADVLMQLRTMCGMAKADLDRARKICTCLRTPGHTLRQYHDDLIASFPEVRFYFIADPLTTSGRAETTSGDAGGETEYLRTMGAFFAIYWVSRLGMDGERGFSFGVDESDRDWKPAEVDGDDAARNASLQRKKSRNSVHANGDAQALFFTLSSHERAYAFYRNTDWAKVGELMVNAGLLTAHPHIMTGPKAFSVCTERMVGMLALTAFHDIMKVDTLLPTVQAQHAPFCGFKAGDRINDHDVALGYILEHYGHALPSYAELPPSLKLTIRFTQVKLAFNHGWFVQAEAPPGKLMTQFKYAISASEVEKTDISFYFVHWLTDLAGAEPTPLKGSVKFVQRLPHSVLHSFIASFAILGSLVEKTETQVFEAQLVARWNETATSLGPPPTGKHAIALMRLIAQVQDLPLRQRLLGAWPKLDPDDAEILSFEMALTGCPGQNYEAHPHKQGGPAFLIYYSPAFMRTAVRQDALEGLRMLADIYRQVRAMWPFSESAANRHVAIRIDQIKDHSPDNIMENYSYGEGWLVVKHNDQEAVVEHHPLYTLTELTGQDYRVLAFWRQFTKLDELGEGHADLINELKAMRRDSQVRESDSTSNAGRQTVAFVRSSANLKKGADGSRDATSAAGARRDLSC